MTKKRGLAVLLLGLVALLCWHFLIKSHQHKVSFTSKDTPGVVYSNLLSWEFIKELPDSSQVKTLSHIPFRRVEQLVTVKDSSFTYVWELSKANDSLTQVTAFISDNNNAFKQNLAVPFANTKFESRNINTIEALAKEWIAYRSKYRINEVRKEPLVTAFSACISVQSKVSEKASTMMRNIADVMGFINTNNLELAGDPYLEITKWDQKTQNISYDFCFPIKKTDSLPKSEIVKFKEAKNLDGLMCSFNGNYSIADKAWHSLIDYAQRKDIEIQLLPTEVYLDDPHSGGNALQWEAKVFMPLKQQ